MTMASVSCRRSLGDDKKDTDFVDSIITDNEGWCFACNPLTKQQSAAWVGPKLPHAKKPRFKKSKIKTMLILFFDNKGVVYKEFVSERPGSHKQSLLKGFG